MVSSSCSTSGTRRVISEVIDKYQNIFFKKPTGQSRFDNAETMSILSAQDTGRRQKKHSTQN
jgi:hypothetical protein